MAMTQRAAAPTAVIATDIASAVAMILTHSQIVKAKFQSAQCRTGIFRKPRPGGNMQQRMVPLVLPATPHIAKSMTPIAPTESASVKTDNT